MTRPQFVAALRDAGLAVAHGLIVDASGRCPGFSTVAIFRGNGSVAHNATLSKVVWERDAQIERRAAAVKRAT
jgi:hypothetical protein